MKKFFTFVLAALMLLSAAACATPARMSGNSQNLAENRDVPPSPPVNDDAKPVTDAQIADFAVKLFAKSFDGNESTLISPTSVLYALAMAANGAYGTTLKEFEETFGVSMDDLNDYLKQYRESLTESEKVKLAIANSLWLKENGLSVKEEFLDKNTYYYGADIYKAPFDKTTVNDINAWVSENTDGLIEKILNDLPASTVMCLLNAVCFDAEWASIYSETAIRKMPFTSQSGKKHDVEMMLSTERLYIEDENAIGFIKNYSGGKYAFVGILPNDGVDLKEYVNSLTGEHLSALIMNAQKCEVHAQIPKFEAETTVEMSAILSQMGIKSAFTPGADFSQMATYDGYGLFIDKVTHKAIIKVDERGTKAGAVTAIEMAPTSVAPSPQEPKTVTLDRPFLYMIIDTATGNPIFMGAATDVK